MEPSSRVMTVKSPLPWSAAVAASGGQFLAQSPLQALLPEPATSLSNTYSVMPDGSVSTPPCVCGAAAYERTLAASMASAKGRVKEDFMAVPCSRLGEFAGLHRRERLAGRVYSAGRKKCLPRD